LEDLSLHILDIAENSIAAGAKNLEISIREDTTEDMLTIQITDDGKGMSADELRKAGDPFYTTRTTRRIGLGLALLDEAARAANGKMEIHSEPGAGTSVRATFQLSHVDRKPLGKMADTIIALIACSRGTEIIYRHERNERTVLFDTREFKAKLSAGPLSSPEVLNFIQSHLIQQEERLDH
jgi:anti-sigma regulatory factor (Ser/Thr protein kinase)